MPATISLPEAAPPPLRVEPETRRALWTRESIRRAASLGFLDPERYELLDGELIEKMKNRRHTITLRRVRQALLAFFAEEYLQSEAPIDVAPYENETNAPEPDLVVLTRPGEAFLDTNPGPAGIALVIEVADSTLRRDLGRKAVRYARAGIVEYWVVDVESRRVIVHREPNPDGEWGSVITLATDETIASLAAPNISLLIGKIFAT